MAGSVNLNQHPILVYRKSNLDKTTRSNVRCNSVHWTNRVSRSALAALIVIALCQGAMGAEPKSDQSSTTVNEYCGAFAKAYAETKSSIVVPDSMRIKARPRILRWMSNSFQPRNSRFVAGYRCRFATLTAEEKHQKFAVYLYLTETLEFAERTQWERLQIIPIKLVQDTKRKRSGYGVFKYLEEE